MDDALLAAIEEASLNASAPPQQRWLDGWLLRYCPGSAKRARSINAVANGRLTLEARIARARAVYREAGLPMLARITPFSCPMDLDERLAALGWTRFDETCVMRVALATPLAMRTAPTGARWEPTDPRDFAKTVGELRASSEAERAAHAARLAYSPVRYQALVLRSERGVLACGQFALEGDLAGLYDIATAAAERGRGFASALCEHLLALAQAQGAGHAYLQVGAENHIARRLYSRLGFEDAYRYHYRQAPDSVSRSA